MWRAPGSPDGAQKLWILQQNASVYRGRNLSCLAALGAFLPRKQAALQWTRPSLPSPTGAI